MKIEQTHIDQIRTAFQKMQSKEDLLHLLNEAKPFVYGEKAVPFQLKQLTWYSNPKLAKKRYTEFKIKKKSGAERTINAPVKGLKALQKTLSFVLQCIYEPHQAVTGFVRGKSIVDNAKVHTASKYVYNIDLKDFFPNIEQARIWKCLQLKPFNLSKEFDNKIVVYESTFLKFGFRLIEQSINNINQKILYIKYEDILLKTGSFNIKLKAGGALFFDVNVNETNLLNGFIKVNTSKSNLLPLIEVLKKEIKEITNDDVVSAILSLIKNNFNKRTSKNTRSNLANILASLCCIESERTRLNNKTGQEENLYVLPQGGPTSPILSNVVCQRMDYLLSAVAKRFGLKYSRYADDMTFSSMYNVYQKDSEFIKELHRIIAEQGFHIKESKTRLQKEGYRQEVTGLLVNENVNVQKRYIKQLRMWLYYWETYGYTKAYNFFLKQYVSDKGHNVKGKPDMANVIDGKLNYLKMVKGEENDLYMKLRERFGRLINKQSFMTKVLNTWEANGIESAMELYYSKNTELSTDNSEIATKSNDIHDILDNLLL